MPRINTDNNNILFINNDNSNNTELVSNQNNVISNSISDRKILINSSNVLELESNENNITFGSHADTEISVFDNCSVTFFNTNSKVTFVDSEFTENNDDDLIISNSAVSVTHLILSINDDIPENTSNSNISICYEDDTMMINSLGIITWL